MAHAIARSQLRIALEAEAVTAILQLCHTQKVELVSSTALLLEISRNPHVNRRKYAESILAIATVFVATSDDLVQRSAALTALGFKAMDTLHLAAAETSNSDYFCTCDDRILRRAKITSGLAFQPVSPLELVEELDK